MEDTSGFYKLEDNQLFFAPNTIMSSEYELLRENHSEYTYPTYGWYWFDSELLARQFFNLPENPVE